MVAVKLAMPLTEWGVYPARRCGRLCVALLSLLVLFGVGAALSACRPKRPYGTQKLGRIEDLLGSETYLERDHFLVRRDQEGFSVMSTQCTVDLSPLVMKRSAGQCELVSRETASKYDCNGKVLSGPADHNLPFYEIFAAPGEYEQSKADTLFVWVGKEKPPAWRFKGGR